MLGRCRNCTLARARKRKALSTYFFRDRHEGLQVRLVAFSDNYCLLSPQTMEITLQEGDRTLSRRGQDGDSQDCDETHREPPLSHDAELAIVELPIAAPLYPSGISLFRQLRNDPTAAAMLAPPASELAPYLGEIAFPCPFQLY